MNGRLFFWVMCNMMRALASVPRLAQRALGILAVMDGSVRSFVEFLYACA